MTFSYRVLFATQFCFQQKTVAFAHPPQGDAQFVFDIFKIHSFRMGFETVYFAGLIDVDLTWVDT